jgi:hypothetical protein
MCLAVFTADRAISTENAQRTITMTVLVAKLVQAPHPAAKYSVLITQGISLKKTWDIICPSFIYCIANSARKRIVN